MHARWSELQVRILLCNVLHALLALTAAGAPDTDARDGIALKLGSRM